MILIEETDNRFYVKKSTIEGAGLGLFAAVPLKKLDVLEIIGVQVKIHSTADKCTEYAFRYKFAAAFRYKFAASNKEHAERSIVPMGYAAFINHDPERQNAAIHAAKNRIRKNSNAGQMVYVMVRDIEKDEEILADYGEHWDETFKWLRNRDKDWESLVDLGLYNLSDFREIAVGQCQE